MQLIKKLYKSNIFRISSLNGLSVLVRIIGGLAASKVLAEFIGPQGLALIGNFRNFLASLEVYATLGFQNGIVKYIAENEKENEKLHRVLATAFISLLIAIAAVSILLLATSGYWNSLIFGKKYPYGWIFKITALSLPWFAGSIVLMAIINGLGRYRQVIIINIWGNIAGVALSSLLIWKLNTPGAMLGLLFSPAFIFVFSYYLLQKQFPGLKFLRRSNFDGEILRGLLSYSFMALFTILTGSIVNISIRNRIISVVSLNEAGYWEAMTRIAVFYLMFVTTLLSVYFFPKLAKAGSDKETKAVFLNYYKLILPLFIPGIAVIYFCREFIVRLILSDDFLPVTHLFFWQLLGDLFKVCSLILGYQFFAKKMTRAFIVTELFSYVLLYFSSLFLIDRFGAGGAVMAHAFTYCIYLLVLVLYFRKIFTR